MLPLPRPCSCARSCCHSPLFHAPMFCGASDRGRYSVSCLSQGWAFYWGTSEWSVQEIQEVRKGSGDPPHLCNGWMWSQVAGGSPAPPCWHQPTHAPSLADKGPTLSEGAARRSTQRPALCKKGGLAAGPLQVLWSGLTATPVHLAPFVQAWNVAERLDLIGKPAGQTIGYAAYLRSTAQHKQLLWAVTSTLRTHPTLPQPPAPSMHSPNPCPHPNARTQ